MSNFNIDNLIDQFVVMGAEHVKADSVWREKPVDLVTFFNSPNFLNENPFPGKQTELLRAVDFVLNKERPTTPEEFKNVTEIVALLGKGSGKDFLVSGIMAYICYRLCCLADPQDYYGFGQDEPIDVVNVALNAYQANNVFFKKLKARLRNCKWFTQVNYDPSNHYRSKYNEFQITQNQIRFYKNITAHSTHSEAESFEGFNPLVVVFDEIGGFDLDVAEEAYDIFSSSSNTRFNEHSLLLFISYPRHSKDFMMQKYNDSDKSNSIWSIKGKSWEVNPNIKRSSLQKHYDKNPEKAKTLYECDPPTQESGLYQFPERVDECSYPQTKEIVVEEIITKRTLHTGAEMYYRGLKVYGLDKLDRNAKYFIGGDAGVEDDSYCISLMKAEPVLSEVEENGILSKKYINKPVEELLLKWEPSKKDRLPVDLLNVADILEEICKIVFVESALFDKFNSAECTQRLQSYGVVAEDKNFSNPFQFTIHSHLKSLVYTHMVELLDIEEANEQIKNLKVINGNKIDHDKEHGKDYADARASAAWLCSTSEAEEAQNYSMPVILGARRKTS